MENNKMLCILCYTYISSVIMRNNYNLYPYIYNEVWTAFTTEFKPGKQYKFNGLSCY